MTDDFLSQKPDSPACQCESRASGKCIIITRAVIMMRSPFLASSFLLLCLSFSYAEDPTLNTARLYEHRNFRGSSVYPCD